MNSPRFTLQSWLCTAFFQLGERGGGLHKGPGASLPITHLPTCWGSWAPSPTMACHHH
jgi:hypothetical protein